MFRTALVLALMSLAGIAGCGGETGESTGASTAPPRPRAPPADPSKLGTITGIVTFKGTPPAPVKVSMSGSAECILMHKEPPQIEQVSVKEGRLANVYVRVKDGAGDQEYDAPSDPVLMDQVGCLFRPRVMAIMVGQKLVMKNSDSTLHNVHITPRINREFNKPFPFKDQTQEAVFKKPEVMVPVRCDLHGWMAAFIGVSPHPFHQVTGPGGDFTLKGVPPGKITLEAWHETLGTKTAVVEVKAGSTEKVEIGF